MNVALRMLSVSVGIGLRTAFLRLLTGLVVGLPPEAVRQRILALPRIEQAALVTATALGLLLATLVFAHAGPCGPLAMWITLWMVIR